VPPQPPRTHTHATDMEAELSAADVVCAVEGQLAAGHAPPALLTAVMHTLGMPANDAGELKPP